MERKSGVAVDVGDTGSGGESLQARFMRFRKQRAKALRMSKRAQAKKRSSAAFKAALRRKFIDTAKKYIGVPYAQRYHKPGDALYDAPLFLDCCGLVRRVMDDLQEDFGFRIGRWNQAYMFDTLPVKLEKDELQPGDLVFYSATFYKSSHKVQKHDMVHVEIFLGGDTGEATIGSRFQKGTIKLFDSYKFTSKNYHSVKHHFRSLDTWLEGVCKSFCKEHAWEQKGFSDIDSAKSVFFQGGEGAGVDSDDEPQDAADEAKKTDGVAEPDAPPAGTTAMQPGAGAATAETGAGAGAAATETGAGAGAAATETGAGAGAAATETGAGAAATETGCPIVPQAPSTADTENIAPAGRSALDVDAAPALLCTAVHGHTPQQPASVLLEAGANAGH